MKGKQEFSRDTNKIKLFVTLVVKCFVVMQMAGESGAAKLGVTMCLNKLAKN